VKGFFLLGCFRPEKRKTKFLQAKKNFATVPANQFSPSAGTTLVPHQFSHDSCEWRENQSLSPDWTYFYCPGATLLQREKIDWPEPINLIVSWCVLECNAYTTDHTKSRQGTFGTVGHLLCLTGYGPTPTNNERPYHFNYYSQPTFRDGELPPLEG